jgi:hypothetical protein
MLVWIQAARIKASAGRTYIFSDLAHNSCGAADGLQFDIDIYLIRIRILKISTCSSQQSRNRPDWRTRQCLPRRFRNAGTHLSKPGAPGCRSQLDSEVLNPRIAASDILSLPTANAIGDSEACICCSCFAATFSRVPSTSTSIDLRLVAIISAHHVAHYLYT